MPPEATSRGSGVKPVASLTGASGAWEWDIPGDRLYGDARFADLYGLNPGEARSGLATQAFFKPVDPRDRMRVRISVAGVLHGAEVFAREYRLVTSDGEVRWVSAKGRLHLDDEGAPSRFTGVLSDISEQKRVQEQLRVAQTAGGVGSFEYVSGFGTASVSEQFCRLLGLHPAESLPVRTINSVVVEGGSPIVPAIDAHPDQQSAYAEFRIRRADNDEERWLARRGEVVVDAAALGQRFVGVVYDVTTAKESEARLRDLAQTLETRVEISTRERDRLWTLSRDLFAVCDVAGVFQGTNPAWLRTLGYEAGTLEGTLFEKLVHPEDRAVAAAALAALQRGEAARNFECRIEHSVGAWLSIDWTGVASGDEVFLTGRDISQRRQLEEQLRQSQKMEAVGQLTGGLAHDFNNMLTGIMGSMDIMRRRIAEGRLGDLDKFMTAAMVSAERAAALTHRLLAFSRQQSLDTRGVDVTALVASMEDLLRRTLGESTRLETNLALGLPFAWSDSNQLESALLNLAINARDAMAEGGVLTVRTRMVRIGAARTDSGLEKGEYVLLSVTDTGAGMPPEVRDKVFEPFFTTKPIGQGTGLGLSMIYGFMRQTGGAVEIETAPGAGTTINLFLPRAEAISVEPQVAPGARASLTATRGRGERILVVEDDPSVRLLVIDVLAELGYSALEASEAEMALSLLNSNDVDLLITDVGLPGRNGRQLAEMARVRRPDLRVLFMTGYAEQAMHRGDFLEPGMAMITKPFTIDSLGEAIGRMIRGE